MIKIILVKDLNKYVSFNISGHSNSNKFNNEYDMVCASVSSIVFGILNAFDEKYIIINVSENNIYFKVKDFKNERVQIIMDTLYISLYTVKDLYNKFINIKIIENKNE